MQFSDEKKDYEIEFAGIRDGLKHEPFFTFKISRPFEAEEKVTVDDIKTKQGMTGLFFDYFSDLAKIAHRGKKGNVLLTISPEAIDFIKESTEAELDKLRQAAQVDPERWFVALGGDTHRVYATPDTETRTEFRPDLKQVEETLEKMHWVDINLDEIGTKTDRKTGLYTETGWYAVPHSEIMRMYNEITEKKEKKLAEKKAAKEAKESAAFEKAKESGEPQELESYCVDCEDPEEECGVDVVKIYAMPDGTKTRKQYHTY